MKAMISSFQTLTQRKRNNRHSANSTSMKKCRSRHQSLVKIIKCNKIIITNSSRSISKNPPKAVENHLVIEPRISRPHQFRASILGSTSLSPLSLQTPHRRPLMTLVSSQPNLKIKWQDRETCLPKMWSVFSIDFRMSSQSLSLLRNVNSKTIISTLCQPKSLFKNAWTCILNNSRRSRAVKKGVHTLFVTCRFRDRIGSKERITRHCKWETILMSKMASKLNRLWIAKIWKTLQMSM